MSLKCLECQVSKLRNSDACPCPTTQESTGEQHEGDNVLAIIERQGPLGVRTAQRCGVVWSQ
jgi:hypothetical protein